MKRVFISISRNNLRTENFSKDGNINLAEAGIDELYTTEDIIEFLTTENEDLEEDNIIFEDENIENLLLLRELAKEGYIVHNAYNGEEWLTDLKENWIFLGTGNTADWKDVEGVQFDEDMEVYEDNHPAYFQKNKDVSNPVDEYEGWENDFVLNEDSIRIKKAY